MPEDHASERQPSPESAWVRLRKAALAGLFGLILLIPRLRRLRRRVWAWSVVRAATIIVGAAILWHGARRHGGVTPMLWGIVLMAFGALVRARPQTKSPDDTRRELGALVALNGGSLLGADGAKPIPDVTIFVHPERLIVLTRANERLIELPIAQLREVRIQPSPDTSGRKKLTCDLAIKSGAPGAHSACFRYQGTFAEHLARVAQDTIMSVWKKGLPVLPPGSDK
jgi:hypothetical protein